MPDPESPPSSRETESLIVDHYHRTYEITYRFWNRRNRTFLILISAIAIAMFLTFEIDLQEQAEIQSESIGQTSEAAHADETEQKSNLLWLILVRYLELDPPPPQPPLLNSILDYLIMLPVFYLVFNLFHQDATVRRNFGYLGELEKEIRGHLNLHSGVAFTREGDFYKNHRPWLFGLVGLTYVLLLGILLGSFAWYKISLDLHDPYLLAVDAIFVLAIVVYFVFGYAWNTLFGLKSYSTENTEVK